MSKAKRFRAWDVKHKNFPRKASLEEKIRFCLNYGILAPSTHNSQPWLFRVEKDVCKVFKNESINLIESDPKGSYAYISLGCCIENIIIAAKHFGIYKTLRYSKVKLGYVATIYFEDNGAGNSRNKLINAIAKRVNTRGVFKKRTVPSKIVNKLRRANDIPNLKVALISKRSSIHKIAMLTAEGIGKVYGNKNFREELSHWIHNNMSGKDIGMPGYALRLPLPVSFIFPKLMRVYDLSPAISKLNYASLNSMPLIVVISSNKNDTRTWLNVGRLAQRMMLILNGSGVCTSIFVASLEVDELKRNLKKTVGLKGEPQFLFAAGYPVTRQKQTPRQPLEKKILKD